MVPGQAKKLLMMQNRNQMVVHSKIGENNTAYLQVYSKNKL